MYPSLCFVLYLPQLEIHSFQKKKQIQTVWLYILWAHNWKHTLEKIKQVQPFGLCILVWKRFEESLKNTQAILEYIWKHTTKTNLMNATSVTMHLLRPTIWEHIWKNIVEESWTNAIYCNHARQAFENTQCREIEEEKCNQCDFASSLLAAVQTTCKSTVHVKLPYHPKYISPKLETYTRVSRKNTFFLNFALPS